MYYCRLKPEEEYFELPIALDERANIDA